MKTIIRKVLHRLFRGIFPLEKKINISVISENEWLKGRTALITGGYGGIGLAIARSYLKAGAVVIISGRSSEKLHMACQILKQEGYSNIYDMVWDITDVVNQKNKLEEAVSKVYQVDILVNNAGIIGGNMPDACEENYDKVLDINLKAVFFLSQLFGKYFKDNNIRGNILNIVSSSGCRPASSAYAVSKWGIRGLTLGLAKSLIPYGITVNGIAPGPTATAMLSIDRGNISLPNNPLGRFIMPEEIANMATFMVSNMGCSIVGDIVYMTGGAGLITLDDIAYEF